MSWPEPLEPLIEAATRAVEHNTVAYAAMRSGEFDRSETDRYIREIVVVALAAAADWQEQEAIDSAEIDRLIGVVQARIDGTDNVPCPTCSGSIRETVGMVCETCGTDYGRADR